LEFICLPVFDENLLAYKLLKLEKYVSHWVCGYKILCGDRSLKIIQLVLHWIFLGNDTKEHEIL
jgi:hypothetical protein